MSVRSLKLFRNLNNNGTFSPGRIKFIKKLHFYVCTLMIKILREFERAQTNKRCIIYTITTLIDGNRAFSSIIARIAVHCLCSCILHYNWAQAVQFVIINWDVHKKVWKWNKIAEKWTLAQDFSSISTFRLMILNLYLIELSLF